ncbi:hypothetical protein BDV25DRAFT_138627 [Aspergillus avenaceus]|uniref:Apple domain-containing protein n=1 Tax=Aspergillus avenaceus TaxID=36643 RepID=A0A5N6TZJ9_ASPAV|nr:hypothetical protein BDV25DRAFT_138627 [Aspergillus avenaceus]
MFKDTAILALLGLSLHATAQANCLNSYIADASSYTCCHSQPSGAGMVQGEFFHYKCDHYAMPHYGSPLRAYTVQDCAKHCQADNKCIAATFVSGHGTCYLTRELYFKTSQHRNDMLGYIFVERAAELH